MAGKQNFHRGDLVRLKEDFGPSMAHFSGKGGLAIVMGSYSDQYSWGGPDGRHEYSMLHLFEDGTVNGRSSWYHDHNIDYLILPRCDETLEVLYAYQDKDYDLG